MKKIIYIYLFLFLPNMALSSDTLINISNTQQLVLNYLDLAGIKYEYLPSQNKQNITLKNIYFDDNGDIITIDSLQLINLNKKYFDNFTIKSFDKYHGKLFDKIILKNIQSSNFRQEYFEIAGVDIKQINELFNINLENISEFLKSVSIDKIYLKNINVYDDTFEGSFSLKIENIKKFKFGIFKISDLNYENYEKINQFSFFIETILFKNFKIDKTVVDNFIALAQGNSLDPDLSNYMFGSEVELFRINNFNYISKKNDVEFKFARMDSVTDEYPEKGSLEFTDLYFNKINNKYIIYEELIKTLDSNNLYNLVYNYDWDISKKTIFNKFKLTSNNFFNLIFEISLSNYSINEYVRSINEPDKYYSNLLYSDVKFDELMLYYNDNGLIQSIYKVIEREENLSVKETLALSKNELLNNDSIMSFVDKKQLQQIDEIFKFLITPGNIKISINPSPSLTFMQMFNLLDSPKTLLEKLNIDINSNK